MKKLLMAMAAAMMLLGCEKDETLTAKANEPKDSVQAKTITFTFGETAMQPMTRATLSELNLTDLWLFDYVGGEYVQTIHQASTDDGFGAVSGTFDYGTHTLYFVASRGVTPTVSTDAKTITWQTVRDTFWATLQMTVEPATGGQQQVSLSRVVGRLRVVVTDAVPTGAATFEVTPTTWYCGLNYQTGEATASSTSPIVVNIPSSYIGTTKLASSVYTISGATPWETGVTAAIKASDNSTLGSVTISDIPIRRNHITSYSGSIMAAGRSLSISSADEWVEDDNVVW
jgi:hypothetical protein